MAYYVLNEHPFYLSRLFLHGVQTYPRQFGPVRGSSVVSTLRGGRSILSVLQSALLALQFLRLVLAVAADEAVHCVYKCLLVHLQTMRTFADIRVACYLVGYHRHALYYTCYGFRPFYRVADAIEQQVSLELYEVRLMHCDILSQLLRTMLARETVRVVTVRKYEHLDVHSLSQQHVSASHGRVYARFVAIVEQNHVLREPM